MRDEERLYAALREYERITPPSLDVQTMSFTRRRDVSSGGVAKSGGKCSRVE